MGRVSGRSIGQGTGGGGSTGGNGGGGNGGGGTSGSTGGNGGGGTSGSTGGGGRPARESVFVSPPPETVTVAPPGYEAPEKPTPRGDPSTEGSFKPFGDILAGSFGEPTQQTGVSTDPFRTIEGQLAFLQPEQQVIPQEQDFLPPEEEQVLPPATCPRNCNIIHIPTGIVSYEGMCSCSTIERYEQDPNYRVEFTTAEPEIPIEPEQMEFLCSDVYTLENGNVIKTSYDTLSVSQIQNFISQGLLIRDCGTPSPSVEEVRSHYGYTADVEPPPEEPEEEPVTVDIPPPEFPPEPEPTVTVTPGLPTTANFGIAGILFAGVLALPILAGLGKWK